jgi:hypothetical protein
LFSKGKGGGGWRDASSSESEGERDEYGKKINKGSTVGAAIKGKIKLIFTKLN